MTETYRPTLKDWDAMASYLGRAAMRSRPQPENQRENPPREQVGPTDLQPTKEQ